uniref:ABC transporter B family member 9-like n=1 Tax=Rhizophora mucronata TaxID=61149 RepID=A0A2P2MWT9_RHIMU
MSGDTVLIQDAMGKKVCHFVLPKNCIVSFVILPSFSLLASCQHATCILINAFITGWEVYTATINIYRWLFGCIYKRMVSGFSLAFLHSSTCSLWVKP